VEGGTLARDARARQAARVLADAGVDTGQPVDNSVKNHAAVSPESPSGGLSVGFE
jgi:hypothetical protein